MSNNGNKASHRSFRNQMVTKNMVARDHFPFHPAIFRHESPSGVRGQSLPELDTSARSIKTCIKQIFVLA
jgi:hypothetical protein